MEFHKQFTKSDNLKVNQLPTSINDIILSYIDFI